MKNYPHPVIAREGWFYIFISFAVTVVVTCLWGIWSLPLWLISLFVLQFFRDPARTVPDIRNAVVSPADGRIVVIEKTQDIYGQREALKISVFMNVFNVHSNRFPVDGKVESVHYFPGKFVNSFLDAPLHRLSSAEQPVVYSQPYAALRSSLAVKSPRGHFIETP